MKSRILFALLLVSVLISAAAIVYAQNHESLTPLLIDHEGWTADKAEGMSMDMGSMKMVTASRRYAQGEKEIHAVIMIGNQAMTLGKMQEMKMESSDGKVTVTEIGGFKVQTVYRKKGNSSSVVVFLAQGQTSGAIFVLSCEGLSEAEALAAAKKFNWMGMKTAAEKFL